MNAATPLASATPSVTLVQPRFIKIGEDGSLLDETALSLVAEMADANDMQVWIERVDSSGKIGFVLEDGHVRKAEAQRTEGA